MPPHIQTRTQLPSFQLTCKSKHCMAKHRHPDSETHTIQSHLPQLTAHPTHRHTHLYGSQPKALGLKYLPTRAIHVSRLCIRTFRISKGQNPRWLPTPITHHDQKQGQHTYQRRSLQSLSPHPVHSALSTRDHRHPINCAPPTCRHLLSPASSTLRES